MQIELLEEKTILTLEGVLDASLCVELKQTLLKAMEAAKPTEVVATNVARIDSTCAQVMVSAQKSFETAGIELHLLTPSEKMLENLTSINLNSYIQVKEC